jgi:hypothetical protein
MPRLTDSREEARQIVHLAPAGTVALRTGFDATPEQVRTLKATDASILHFATHTVTVPAHPEISGIALSMLNREGKEQDGIFWLKDIYGLHLPLSLVVLSGCTTDNLGNDPGEGLNSVAHASSSPAFTPLSAACGQSTTEPPAISWKASTAICSSIISAPMKRFAPLNSNCFER